MKKETTKEQIEASEKIKRYLSYGVMKRMIYEKMGITAMTFEKRLNVNDWRKLEIEFINNMKLE
jgi:hypothetical protein